MPGWEGPVENFTSESKFWSYTIDSNNKNYNYNFKNGHLC